MRDPGNLDEAVSGVVPLDHLRDFVRESNRIEGIIRSPSAREIRAHERFLALESPAVADFQAFVWVVARQPIRDLPGMNVRVGNHVAPPGGPGISGALGFILDNMRAGTDAYTTHLRYETLHPFMDGNGRSGRVLWLWQMLREGRDPYALRRGFLHTFYYQTLNAIPQRREAADTSVRNVPAREGRKREPSSSRASPSQPVAMRRGSDANAEPSGKGES